MRIAQWTLGALLIAGLSLGCSGTDEKPSGPTTTRKPESSGKTTPSRSGTGTGRTPGTTTTDTGGSGSTSKPTRAPQSAKELLADYSQESKLQDAANISLAQSEYEIGKRLYEELRYKEAERHLKVAVEKDPNLEEARRLLHKTQFILGDREHDTPSVIERLQEDQRVRVQEFQIGLERTMNEGIRHFEQEDFDSAKEKFELALEQISYFPYEIDTARAESDARTWLDRSVRRQEEKERERRRLIQQAAEREAQLDRNKTARQLQERIANLHRKAEEAYDKEEYEKCEAICDDIIELDYRDRRAERLRANAIQARHIKKALENIRSRIEHLRGQVVAVKTSSIPYQEIFRWPTKEEWEAINLRSQGLQKFFTPDETPETQRIKEKLELQRITLNFEETPFASAVDFLKDVTGLNFVISAKADEIVEGESLVVTLKVTDLPLKNALRLILDHNEELDYSIRNDVVFITTTEDVQEDLYLEFYNVSDIIGKIPDYPAPKLALAPVSSTGSGAGTGVLSFDDDDDDGTKGTGVDIETLISLIEEKLGEENDAASVEASPGGILVVRHTLEAHKKIQRLLASLRKTVGIMVTVEARFIDIQDNFLENIGVDYRGLPAQILNVDGSGTNQNIGYRYVDAQNQNDTRASIVNTFSSTLGSSSANPFNFFETGGVAAQYNLLENYQLQMVLEAVKKTQKARLVNNPRVTVFNTQRSHVLVVNQEAYIADTEINQTGITPVLNPVIGILNSGSILEARPTVSHDRKYVTLEVQPTLAVDLTTPLNVANLNLATSLTQIPIELPVLRVQKIRTTVTVPDGGTVIVGGLRDLRRVKNQAGVPILTDLVDWIPFVRIFFQKQGESSLKRSIVVLLKADITVIREEEEKLYNPRY